MDSMVKVFLLRSDLVSAKKQLESNLFEAQQQNSVIKVTKGQMEIQIQTIIQAKEVIQGEVKCLKLELDAERSRAEQEWDAVTRQLAQAEQEGQAALERQKVAHEEEVNRLQEKWEKERFLLQQELDKTLETLERERTDLEMRLREQQTETEALHAQREEERTQADSTLYELSSWSIRIPTCDSPSLTTFPFLIAGFSRAS
ncbi:Centrosome-associated protein CEP250 [Lemmus lemmus]